MDLSINELVARGRLAAEACAWELNLDGCPTRPPTAADLIAIGNSKPTTEAEMRSMCRGIFLAEVPATLESWGVDEATAALQSYTEYFKVWQPKKQTALASGVAGAVREAIQREAKTSKAKPG